MSYVKANKSNFFLLSICFRCIDDMRVKWSYILEQLTRPVLNLHVYYHIIPKEKHFLQDNANVVY